jgi:hypothetical protein
MPFWYVRVSSALSALSPALVVVARLAVVELIDR